MLHGTSSVRSVHDESWLLRRAESRYHGWRLLQSQSYQSEISRYVAQRLLCLTLSINQLQVSSLNRRRCHRSYQATEAARS